MMWIDCGNNILIGSVFAVLVGVLLGVFYFTGLWWTVRRLSTSQSVALLFLGSLLLRASVVIAGFYLMFGEDWRQLLLGLLGLMVGRLLVTWFIRRKEQTFVKNKAFVIKPVLPPK